MITFGIITNRSHHSTLQESRIQLIIESIQKQNIPNYEIIIVGDYNCDIENVKCIEFDETIKPNWITKKKNIITQSAKNNIIVYLHDYIVFCDGWFEGWEKFGFDWDLGMNIILNKDETRFRDWCVFKHDGNTCRHGIWVENTPKHPSYLVSPYIPSYDYKQTSNMYISGSYWLAKKSVMLEEPLDEDFVWGQPEDIEWSLRVLNKYKYVMNTHSIVQLLHQKDPVFKPLNDYHMSNEYIQKVNKQ